MKEKDKKDKSKFPKYAEYVARLRCGDGDVVLISALDDVLRQVKENAGVSDNDIENAPFYFLKGKQYIKKQV